MKFIFEDPIDHQFSTIVQMQKNSCLLNSKKPVFGTRVGDKFHWITYGIFGQMVEQFRHVLSRHRIGKDDKIAIISNNRVEWAVVMYAAAAMGAQVVPL